MSKTEGQNDQSEAASKSSGGLQYFPSFHETFGQVLAIAHVLSKLENTRIVEAPSQEIVGIAKHVMSAVIGNIVEFTKFEIGLQLFAPDEELFQNGVTERYRNGTLSFQRILDRLLEIRKERNEYLNPSWPNYGDTSYYQGPEKVTLLSIELFARLLGCFDVLSSFEVARDGWAIPIPVFSHIVIRLMEKLELDKPDQCSKASRFCSPQFAALRAGKCD